MLTQNLAEVAAAPRDEDDDKSCSLSDSSPSSSSSSSRPSSPPEAEPDVVAVGVPTVFSAFGGSSPCCCRSPTPAPPALLDAELTKCKVELHRIQQFCLPQVVRYNPRLQSAHCTCCGAPKALRDVKLLLNTALMV